MPQTRIEPREVQAYVYASCQTCRWKLSREGSADSTTGVVDQIKSVVAKAIDHAVDHGHRMLITENSAAEYDFRVERPT